MRRSGSAPDLESNRSTNEFRVVMSGKASSSSGPITVASLVQREVSLEWQEAVAIALEVADVLERSGKSLLPTYHDLELTPDGTVRFLRQPNRPSDPVATLVDIFRALLPADAPEHVWTLVSGTGPDSPVYGSVSDFAAAIRSFERPGRPDMLSAVYRRAAETSAPSGDLDTTPAGSAQVIPLDMLHIDDIHADHPSSFDSAMSESLAPVVLKHGLLQPLLVRRRGSGYELVVGGVWLAAAKTAGLSVLPCRVCDVDDEEAHALAGLDGGGMDRENPATAGAHRVPDLTTVLDPTLGELTGSLGAAMSCWGLSAEGIGRPYHRTVSEVTKVELQRAIWLVEGLRVLSGRPLLNRGSQNLGSLLDRVFTATRPERRLASTRLLANLTEASIALNGDDRLLVMAYGGTLQAILALVGQTAPAVVRCDVAARDSAAVVELSQDKAPVSPTLMTRFFDESYHGRPGGYSAAVALAAARRVMELHGGAATIHPREPQGCRVVLQLPR